MGHVGFGRRSRDLRGPPAGMALQHAIGTGQSPFSLEMCLVPLQRLASWHEHIDASGRDSITATTCFLRWQGPGGESNPQRFRLQRGLSPGGKFSTTADLTLDNSSVAQDFAVRGLIDHLEDKRENCKGEKVGRITGECMKNMRKIGIFLTWWIWNVFCEGWN